MDRRLITAAIVVLGVPLVLVGYILLTERLLRFLPEKRQGRIRPWLWIAPALAFLVVFLIYPTINTIVLSLMDATSKNFVGLDNYLWFFGDRTHARGAAQQRPVGDLHDRRRRRPGAAHRGPGRPRPIRARGQDSHLRAAGDQLRRGGDHLELHVPVQAAGHPADRHRQRGRRLVGLRPLDWIQERDFLIGNFSLIFIGVWMWTGFAMVILSAGLKGISVELLEAARVDGANEWQVFRRIILPLLLPTIYVVGTTIVITALKSFDIVYTLTNGEFGTDVIARKMFFEMFTTQHFGRASAVGDRPAASRSSRSWRSTSGASGSRRRSDDAPAPASGGRAAAGPTVARVAPSRPAGRDRFLLHVVVVALIVVLG